MEAIGSALYADILENDPKSINGPESAKKAFETLDSKKKSELGLMPSSATARRRRPSLVYGNHLFGVCEDEGLKRDDSKYFFDS